MDQTHLSNIFGIKISIKIYIFLLNLYFFTTLLVIIFIEFQLFKSGTNVILWKFILQSFRIVIKSEMIIYFFKLRNFFLLMHFVHYKIVTDQFFEQKDFFNSNQKFLIIYVLCEFLIQNMIIEKDLSDLNYIFTLFSS